MFTVEVAELTGLTCDLYAWASTTMRNYLFKKVQYSLHELTPKASVAIPKVTKDQLVINVDRVLRQSSSSKSVSICGHHTSSAFIHMSDFQVSLSCSSLLTLSQPEGGTITLDPHSTQPS